MNKKLVKIYLYGESFKIHSLSINEEHLNQFNSVATKLQEPLEQAVLNISFFEMLSIKDISSIQSLKKSTFGGLMNTTKSKVEIRVGRKLMQKFTLNDLFYPLTLFPIFNIKNQKINVKLQNSLFLIEKEIGMIAMYEIDVHNFDINKLKFNIRDVTFLKDEYPLLLNLSYDNQILKSKKSDTLLTYQYCVSYH